MALALVTPNGVPDIRQAFDRLQLAQFQHDEMYHREIARLSTQDRLKHMALHFAKYVGNLAVAGDDEAQRQRVIIDVFIIGTSCANTLNLNLTDAMPARAPAVASSAETSSYITILTINMGKMAASCEKLDHLEDFPFRTVIRDAVIAIVDATISYAESQRWDLQDLVKARLKGVKEKAIFHGRI